MEDNGFLSFMMISKVFHIQFHQIFFVFLLENWLY